ncbi:28S ribosomal protein S22, mitochondrial-like [Orbicella faveolata]|uniref:28S ribosomal protein S22, mitochondrial-like n=1 Tax=Orbicella faveolata TaxID=48498 RepID=UPI0009E30DE2|nr:28S ribosomal protein S22, mitochondrial-like [Orbicella faveolata]
MAATCRCIRVFKFPVRSLLLRTFCSHESPERNDNIPPFDNNKVQTILKKITGRNLDKIFAARKQNLDVPSYKLMTDEEYLEAQHEIKEKAANVLEMPPVMDERQEINEVIEENDELAHFSESNFVFTDISTSVDDRTRSITIREPSGRLRKATWEERDRMNFIYFPKPGRKYEMPELLKDEVLETVFQQNRHEDVLDLACVQFEPDSADYIRVHHQTYEDIFRDKKFDVLRSTRHFGGLVYYLAKSQRIVEILDDMMERELWDDCIQVVRLHHLCHPKSTIAEQAHRNNLKGFFMVRAYIRRHGSPGLLEKLEDYMLQANREKDVEKS